MCNCPLATPFFASDKHTSRPALCVLAMISTAIRFEVVLKKESHISASGIEGSGKSLMCVTVADIYTACSQCDRLTAQKKDADTLLNIVLAKIDYCNEKLQVKCWNSVFGASLHE